MKPEEVPFVALPAHPSEASAFTCGLCGYRFMHGGLVCGTCPMQTGCALVRCPNCGFQFPRSSWIADAFGRLLRRLRRKS
jgi:NMD protein affecting ribosome stability and mRNA decay